MMKLIKAVMEECDVCKKNSRSKLRPTVALPGASNQYSFITLDLKDTSTAGVDIITIFSIIDNLDDLDDDNINRIRGKSSTKDVPCSGTAGGPASSDIDHLPEGQVNVKAGSMQRQERIKARQKQGQGEFKARSW